MGSSQVSPANKQMLWGKSAGRCQYTNCNKSLSIDDATRAEFNQSYVAHIIASKPGGPRGDDVLSKKLKNDIDNIMLLCDAHHRLIDKVDVAGHPVELLGEMKFLHEKRIQSVSSIDHDRGTTAIMYGANIGEESSLINLGDCKRSILNNGRFPEIDSISISLENSNFTDSESNFWDFEVENLERGFSKKVVGKEICHFSIFGLAPQPLLIKLGTLLNDLKSVDVYQKQRDAEPSWMWPNDEEPLEFKVVTPEEKKSQVALVFSISATVSNERITSVLGKENVINKVIQFLTQGDLSNPDDPAPN